MLRFSTFLALATFLLVTFTANPARAQITVTGIGTVSVPPDIARINIGVTHQADTAAGAMEGMITAMQSVFARLEDAGLAAADIQTGQVLLDRRSDLGFYEPGTAPEGFQATTRVAILVRDLAALGGVLDAVVADGATELSDLRFDVTDSAPYVEKARRAAVANAIDAATVLADAAGLTLGSIITMTESQGYFLSEPMFEASQSAVRDVPIAAGEISVSRGVDVVFAITP